MHARLSTYQAARDSAGGLERILEREFLHEFEHIDGYSGMVGLLDRASGKCVVISFWESDAAMRASDEPATRIRSAVGKRLRATETPTVERYEVALHEVRTPVHL
jgi:heme-degrading monooxygenase HmoA